MTSGQRGGIALAFVAVLGVVLARPILTADQTSPPPRPATETAEPTTPEEPVETPSPTPTEDETSPAPIPTEEPETPAELTGRVPEACLEARSLPSPGSVVVGTDDGRIASVPLAGGAGATFEVDAGSRPPTFSPSGEYIAYGSGGLMTAAGEMLDPVSDEPRVWAWSPQFDCVFALTNPSVLSVHEPPDGATTWLLTGPLTSFALTPGGDRVVVFADDAAALYDLRSGERIGEQVAVPNPSEPLLWVGSNLYYGTPSGEGFDVGRLNIRTEALRLAPKDYEVIIPGSQARCVDRALAVDVEGRLIDLEAGERFGEDNFRYGRPSCSQDGSFIAVARWPRGSSPLAARVIALDEDGGYVSDIGSGDGEALPEWGPRGTGVVYLSLQSRSGPGEIIHAQTSGGRTLPVQVGEFRGFDWSATAPTGIPGSPI